MSCWSRRCSSERTSRTTISLSSGRQAESTFSGCISPRAYRRGTEKSSTNYNCLSLMVLNPRTNLPCYVPLSHPFVERLIGTLRREYLDHLLFWTTSDLEKKLLDFRTYFNNHRTHTSREGRTPETP